MSITQDQAEKYRRIVAHVIDTMDGETAMDGLDVLVREGLFEPFTAHYPCGGPGCEVCRCEDLPFPRTCYRITPAGQAVLNATKGAMHKSHTRIGGGEPTDGPT